MIVNYPRTLPSVVCLLTVIGLLGGQRILAAANATANVEPGYGLKLSEPPGLEPRIVSMMQTNVAGSMEARVYFVENWEITREQKAQVFFGMLSQAGADDQRKLAHAAVAHVANSNFALVVRHLLNAKLPKTVLSVFMTDTLKRDYRIKLPTLLTLAQAEGHPLQKEARELLRGYLGRDHGTNWVKWEETMMARLQGNGNPH
jgi:hypothetical protein